MGLDKRIGNVLIGIGIVILASLYASTPAHACSCEPVTTAEATERAVAVFKGKVLEVKEEMLNDEGYLAALIDVSETWKGIDETQVIVYTGWSSCQFHFKEGREYVFFPYHSNGKLMVDNCGKSAEVNQATEELAELGDGSVPGNVVHLESELSGQNSVMISVTLLLAGMILFITFRISKNRK